MTKLIEINSCENCKQYLLQTLCDNYCKHPNAPEEDLIVDICKIPTWCPLPDKK